MPDPVPADHQGATSVCELDGYEADDLIATYALAVEAGYRHRLVRQGPDASSGRASR
jgi:hypothetical protein